MLTGLQVDILSSFILPCTRRAERCYGLKLKLQLLHGKQRGGSLLCALLRLSLKSFAGSESKKAFYIQILVFFTQV